MMVQNTAQCKNNRTCKARYGYVQDTACNNSSSKTFNSVQWLWMICVGNIITHQPISARLLFFNMLLPEKGRESDFVFVLNMSGDYSIYFWNVISEQAGQESKTKSAFCGACSHAGEGEGGQHFWPHSVLLWIPDWRLHIIFLLELAPMGMSACLVGYPALFFSSSGNGDWFWYFLQHFLAILFVVFLHAVNFLTSGSGGRSW